MNTILVVIWAVIQSIVLGPEATIKTLEAVGIYSLGYSIIYSTTFSLVVLAAFFWMGILKPLLIWADKFLCSYWIWRWSYGKFVGYVDQQSQKATQERKKGLMKSFLSYYGMGLCHMYVFGVIFIMFKTYSRKKIGLAVSLWLGAITRVIVVASSWALIKEWQHGWIVEEAFDLLVKILVASIISIWVYRRSQTWRSWLKKFQKKEIFSTTIAAS